MKGLMRTLPRTPRTLLLLTGWLVFGCQSDSPGTTETTVVEGEACEGDVTFACVCEPSGLRGTTFCEEGQFAACSCDPDKCQNDAQCSDGVFCNGAEICAPTSEESDDFGCVTTAPPRCDDDDECTLDSCDDDAGRCRYVPKDADGDGFGDDACGGDDCDDDDADRYPGNYEICDDHDEDCDPTTIGEKDLDGDGEMDEVCCNGDRCGRDCNDENNRIHAKQLEICDNLDNDCDGETDEEPNSVPWYLDMDGDNFGAEIEGEEVPLSCSPLPGRSLLKTDCDDANTSRHPGQLEICDFKDNDCDDRADEGDYCGVPLGYPYDDSGIIIDTGTGGSGGETCDTPKTFYQDQDGDSWADADGASVVSCTAPSGFTTKVGDCNDESAAAYPGAPELCDLIDNDCNTLADDGSVGVGSLTVLGPDPDPGTNSGAIVPIPGGFMGFHGYSSTTETLVQLYDAEGQPVPDSEQTYEAYSSVTYGSLRVGSVAVGTNTVLAMLHYTNNTNAFLIVDHSGNFVASGTLGAFISNNSTLSGASFTGSDYVVIYRGPSTYVTHISQAGAISLGTEVPTDTTPGTTEGRFGIASNGGYVAAAYKRTGGQLFASVWTPGGTLVQGPVPIASNATDPAIAAAEGGFWLLWRETNTPKLRFIDNAGVLGAAHTLPDQAATFSSSGTGLGIGSVFILATNANVTSVYLADAAATPAAGLFYNTPALNLYDPVAASSGGKAVLSIYDSVNHLARGRTFGCLEL